MIIEWLAYYRDISTEEVKNLVQFSPEKEATKSEVVASVEGKGIGSTPVEDYDLKSKEFGADSIEGAEQGLLLPHQLNRDVVSVVLNKATGTEGDYDQGKSVSALEVVASDPSSSSSGEDEEEGDTESDGEVVMVSSFVNLVIPLVRSGDVGMEDGVKPSRVKGYWKNQPVVNKVGAEVAYNVLDDLPLRGDNLLESAGDSPRGEMGASCQDGPFLGLKGDDEDLGPSRSSTRVNSVLLGIDPYVAGNKEELPKEAELA
ncbi:hypothetical protein U1Q18_032763, partial [Sarracenia purpurea var. burkii]